MVECRRLRYHQASYVFPTHIAPWVVDPAEKVLEQRPRLDLVAGKVFLGALRVFAELLHAEKHADTAIGPKYID